MDKNKKLFPQRLWDLIHDENYNFCLRWSEDGQKVFLNRSDFETHYLRTPNNQFHTQKAISFVRQMNMYGFRKVDDCYYENDNFKKNCPHLIKNMIRRHSNKGCYSYHAHPDHHHHHHSHSHHHQQQQHHSQNNNSLRLLEGPTRDNDHHQLSLHNNNNQQQQQSIYSNGNLNHTSSIENDYQLARCLQTVRGSLNGLAAPLSSFTSSQNNLTPSSLYTSLANFNFGQSNSNNNQQQQQLLLSSSQQHNLHHQQQQQQLSQDVLQQEQSTIAEIIPNLASSLYDSNNGTIPRRVTLDNRNHQQQEQNPNQPHSAATSDNLPMSFPQHLAACQAAAQQSLITSLLSKQPQESLAVQNLLQSLSSITLANLRSQLSSQINLLSPELAANMSPNSSTQDSNSSSTHINTNNNNNSQVKKSEAIATSNNATIIHNKPTTQSPAMGALDVRFNYNDEDEDDEEEEEDGDAEFETNECNTNESINMCCSGRANDTSMLSQSSDQATNSSPIGDDDDDDSDIILDLAKPSSTRWQT